jgi:hypothetical protein
LDKNSQTPSLAKTINLSSGLKSSSRISGSAVTPTLEATSSPKDLVIASPGISYSLSHTLSGPIGFFSGSLNESILPPYFKILAASSD